MLQQTIYEIHKWQLLHVDAVYSQKSQIDSSTRYWRKCLIIDELKIYN